MHDLCFVCPRAQERSFGRAPKPYFGKVVALLLPKGITPKAAGVPDAIELLVTFTSSQKEGWLRETVPAEQISHIQNTLVGEELDASFVLNWVEACCAKNTRNHDQDSTYLYRGFSRSLNSLIHHSMASVKLSCSHL